MMFVLRIGGSNDFVSRIDPNDRTCSPPGSIDTVSGWGNPKALQFTSEAKAQVAALQVEEIEGCHTLVEEVR